MRVRDKLQVSVVIPLFNKAQTIQRAISSVLSQTLSDFEVVVVDDGSTDSSVDLIRGFSESRIRIVSQSNAGPGAARNRGIRESRAQWVAFLDADDEFLPDHLGRAVQALKRHRDCVASCGGRFWDPRRVNREDHFRRLGITKGPWRLDPRVTPPEMRHQLEFLLSSTIVARRDVLLKYGGFYENRCTFNEDAYLWLQVALNHALYRDPSPVMIWHREDSGLSAGRRGNYPISPILIAPEAIRGNCSVEYMRALEDYLSYRATLEAQTLVLEGDGETARNLLKEFAPREGDRGRRAIISSTARLAPVIRFAKSIPGVRPLFGGLIRH